MTISYEVSEFYGLNVDIYSEEKGIENPEETAYKLMVDYDDAEDGISIVDRFNAFIKDPRAEKVKAMVIGNWEESYDTSPEKLFEAMIAHADTLKELKALFIGEITYEECEISWIIQTGYAGILNAFPNLELLQIRGASDLSLENVIHPNLKTLIIESGGLFPKIIEEVIHCTLPELTHLELWLGSNYYGFDGGIGIVTNLIENMSFTQLKYLGLRNSEIADEIAAYLADHPILATLDVLDLSLGNLSDKGGQALLEGSKVSSLQKLDLHYHYMSDTMVKKLSGLGISVDLSDPQTADEDDGHILRYIYVSE